MSASSTATYLCERAPVGEAGLKLTGRRPVVPPGAGRAGAPGADEGSGHPVADCPAATPVPTAATTPASSCPGTWGRRVRSCPIQPCQSLRHKPVASTSDDHASGRRLRSGDVADLGPGTELVEDQRAHVSQLPPRLAAWTTTCVALRRRLHPRPDRSRPSSAPPTCSRPSRRPPPSDRLARAGSSMNWSPRSPASSGSPRRCTCRAGRWLSRRRCASTPTAGADARSCSTPSATSSSTRARR